MAKLPAAAPWLLALAALLLVLLAAGVSGIRSGRIFPDAFFFPPDPLLGNVEFATDDALAQRVRMQSAVVVGGTAGIGRGVALTLAEAGASVTVVGHSPAKAAAVLAEMRARARYPTEQHFRTQTADLLTVEGCMNLSGSLRASGTRFNYAVLTVGVWPDRQDPRSADGVDKMVALDVLARYLVTRELVPLLEPGARVMSVLASTTRVPAAPPVERIRELAEGTKTDYSLTEMMGTVSVMNDAWMQVLAAQQPEVTLIGTFPGIVQSGLVETSGTFPEWLRPLLGAAERLVGMTPEASGRLHASILTSPNAGKRQVSYFNVKMEGRLANPLAYTASFGNWAVGFLQDVAAKHGPGARADPSGVLA